MICIGISEEHDCGIAIVKNGKLIFALSEERAIRKKFPVGFPKHALSAGVEFLKAENLVNDTIYISVGGRIHVENFELREKPNQLYDLIHKIFRTVNKIGLGRYILGSHLGISILSKTYRLIQIGRRRIIMQHISKVLPQARHIDFFDHHLCHATSAYYASGFNKCLTFTLDASGDGLCSRAFACENGVISHIQSTPFFHSVGYYYYIITKILGFKIGQEGKVTGLAARGDASGTAKVLKQFIFYNSKKNRPENLRTEGFQDIAEVKEALSNFNRDDIAAGIQNVIEEITTNWVSDLIKKNTFFGEKVKLALAGGVFANVLLNQKLAALPNVEEIFVFPAMGDGGLCAGAAFATNAKHQKNNRPKALQHVYLGPILQHERTKEILEKSGLVFTQPEDIFKATAKLLSENKIVGRFDGRMEYGPRALGNRSILCSAESKTANEKLNQKLSRSDFMPFAPAVMSEHADEFFHIQNERRATSFMTVTCDVKSKAKKLFPAIVHVDGTARPQLVSKSDDSNFYFILKSYKEITGYPILVNTSFNIHEEPIVMSAEDAIESFLRAKLDALSIGQFLILNPTTTK